MIIGRVVGEIYATIQHECYRRKKMLIVDKISPVDETVEGYLIAVDSVGSGIGEIVLVIDEGNSARQILQDPMAPVRSIIIGIIDDIQVGN